MNVNERIQALRQEMKKEHIDLYIVPTADYHMSEYVGNHFKERKYMTGFTGSAGTLLVTPTGAHLWTDGRYFLQAEKQLEGTSVILEKAGMPGVRTLPQFLKDRMVENMNIGVDGRCISGAMAAELGKIADGVHGDLILDYDLVDRIWKKRPALEFSKVWIYKNAYAGEPAMSKLSRIREIMSRNKADYMMVSSLYDIAWTLNLRGDDIEHVPVFLSYLLIGTHDAVLFAHKDSLDEECMDYLKVLGVSVEEYDTVYKYISDLNDARLGMMERARKKNKKDKKKDKAKDSTKKKKVMVDISIVNASLLDKLDDGMKIINVTDPIELMRSIKNETEQANTRIAHIKDAVAMTKGICWLKTNVGRQEMTEISVADKFAELRAAQEGFLDLSFTTICGYAEHGAIIHYSATKDTNVEVKPEGLILIDSGGHYLEGTTDITRTMALGPISDEMRRDYTLVLRGAMALWRAKFPKGTYGQNLDALCRMYFWQDGKDYRHGTGHGVGHVLNVHEGPNGFRCTITNGIKYEPFCPGMITSDEPGYYVDGKYGIRIENEIMCVEAEKTEYGQFYRFENLTLVPIDLDAIDVGMLDAGERQQLNDYHKLVRETVRPYLDENEQKWLDTYTREI